MATSILQTTILELDETISAFYDIINKDFGYGYSINSKYFDGVFESPKEINYCPVGRYMENSTNLMNLYLNIKNIHNHFCEQTHIISIPLMREGVVNYLLSMLMNTFYEELDYDEQVAAINLIAYDLSTLADELKSVNTTLKESSESVALKTLSIILDEIIDYCVVFHSRVSMIFGEYKDAGTDYNPKPKEPEKSPF